MNTDGASKAEIPDAKARLASSLSPIFAAALALGLGLALTFWAWGVIQRGDERLLRERFAHLATRFVDAIEKRQNVHQQTLLSGAALLETIGEPTAEQWRILFEQLRIEQRHPGIQGFGYAMVVRPEQKDAHIRQVRAQGFPTYDVRPEGDRDLYTPIAYLEPRDLRNQRALGYDMFSEAVRRSAMERARDTGATAASGRVRLLQETGVDAQRGFLLYTPVFRRPAPGEDVAERRAALRGFVYSPVRAQTFFKLILAGFEEEIGRHVAVEVFDGPSEASENLIFSAYRDEAQDGTRFRSVLPHDAFGHNWTVRLTALPSFADSFDRRVRGGILVGGLLISVLLAAVAGLFTLWQRHQVEAARNKDIIARELSHRVKNLLAVIQSIAGRTFSENRPVAEARQVFADRIDALARVHAALLDSQWSGAWLHDLVQGELVPFGGRAVVSGPRLRINPQMSQQLAMAVHELATNASKHGALSTSAGSVRVEWSLREDEGEARFVFCWAEHGGPLVTPPEREGFGQTLLRRLMGSALCSQPVIEYRPEGLRYTFDCALSRVSQDSAPFASKERA